MAWSDCRSQAGITCAFDGPSEEYISLLLSSAVNWGNTDIFSPVCVNEEGVTGSFSCPCFDGDFLSVEGHLSNLGFGSNHMDSTAVGRNQIHDKHDGQDVRLGLCFPVL